MISRRKIISRSLDNLDAIAPNEDEEDVWYDKDKLCKDHIDEVLAKWEQIDDEIWAKIIVFERNRRVAKAYARSSVISINGSKNGFDGVRIGLNGFDNPMRDSETKVIKKSIGDGFKLKMDDIGNILIKRYGKSNVIVNSTSKIANEETVIGADILQLKNHLLPMATSSKLFDIRKFTANINRELARTYPDCNRLERQCLSAISLVKSGNKLLNNPLWILVINIVALDILKNRMPTISKKVDNIGVRTSTNGSEDPYSTIESQTELIYPAGSDDSNSSSKRGSKRIVSVSGSGSGSGSGSAIGSGESNGGGYNGLLNDSPFEPKPDYEIYDQAVPMLKNKKNNSLQRKKQDDPYYCGLLARIPNFILSSKPLKQKKDIKKIPRKLSSQAVLQSHMQHPIPIASLHQYPQPLFYPYKMYTPHHRLSQSQISLWDARSLVSTTE